MPDLFVYLLTGVRQSEYTIASTGALVNPYTGDWDHDLMDRLDLPRQILQPLVLPGTRVGRISDDICQELGIQPIPVMAVGEHDTASAVAQYPRISRILSTSPAAPGH